MFKVEIAKRFRARAEPETWRVYDGLKLPCLLVQFHCTLWTKEVNVDERKGLRLYQ